MRFRRPGWKRNRGAKRRLFLFLAFGGIAAIGWTVRALLLHPFGETFTVADLVDYVTATSEGITGIDPSATSLDSPNESNDEKATDPPFGPIDSDNATVVKEENMQVYPRRYEDRYAERWRRKPPTAASQGKKSTRTAARNRRDPYGLRSKKPYVKHGQSKLDALRLIGERHSGTTFLTNTLAECFPTINIQNVLLSHKHWFQPTPSYIHRMVQKFGKDGMEGSRSKFGLKYPWYDIDGLESPREVFNTTYVIVMFRDPYDWMEAMRLKPHHWPNHQGYKVTYPERGEDEGTEEEQIDENNNRGSSSGRSRDGRTRRTGRRGNPKWKEEEEEEEEGEETEENGAYVDDDVGGAVGELDSLVRQARFDHAASVREQMQKLKGSTEKLSMLRVGGTSHGKFQARSSTQHRDPKTVRRRDRKRHRRLLENRKHNRPRMANVPLSWQDFVTMPLTLKRDTVALKGQICQKGADHGRISPCQRKTRHLPLEVLRIGGRNGLHRLDLPYGANDPVYEHRKDGSYFDHPLEMRARKIENFLALQTEWDFGGFLPLRYEDMVQRGTQSLIEVVAREFDVQPSCGNLTDLREGRYDLDPGFRDWITKHADWDAERLAGYEPRPVNESSSP